MDKKIIVYLAGPFTNPDWRDYVKNQAAQHKYIDPRNNDQSATVTITGDDLIHGVEISDLIFAYFPKGNLDQGTSVELGVAFGKRKHIVLVNENEFQNPLVVGVAKRHFITLHAGIIYLQNLKSLEQSLEFDAIYNTIQLLNQ